MKKRGTMYELHKFYEDFKNDKESRWAFIERKKKEGVFNRTAEQINRDFNNESRKSYVFKTRDLELFVKGE